MATDRFWPRLCKNAMGRPFEGSLGTRAIVQCSGSEMSFLPESLSRHQRSVFLHRLGREQTRRWRAFQISAPRLAARPWRSVFPKRPNSCRLDPPYATLGYFRGRFRRRLSDPSKPAAVFLVADRSTLELVLRSRGRASQRARHRSFTGGDRRPSPDPADGRVLALPTPICR